MTLIDKYRSIQEQPAQLALEYLCRKRDSRGLLVLPVAAGKSHIIASICNGLVSMGRRVLVIQPNVEILSQNFAKFTAAGGCGTVYSAKAGIKRIGQVTFATLESVYREGIAEQFKGFCLIIDEAHDYPPMKMRNGDESMLGILMKDAGIRNVIGLTATPTRLDRGELKFITRMIPKFYMHVIHVLQVQRMVELGLWSPMLVKDMTKEIGFDGRDLKLNSTFGGYTDASVEVMYRRNELVGKIAHLANVAKQNGRKSILTFVPTIKTATKVAEAIGGCELVTGDTPAKERERIVKAFTTGSISHLVNVGVFGMGFDAPRLDCIIDGKPTNSFADYYQRDGRGRRIANGKENCWRYDLVGNVQRFGKTETVQVLDVDGYGWGVFTGAKQRLITNIPLDITQEFTIETCRQLKHYKAELYRAHTW